MKAPKNFLHNELAGTVPAETNDLTHNGPPQPTAKFTAEELAAKGYHGVYRMVHGQGGAENPSCACSRGERCDTGLAAPVSCG